MAIYKYLRQFWNSEEGKKSRQRQLIAWRRQPATVRLEKPVRLDRARSVGYKAKQGYIVVRQRVDRGGRQRPAIEGGRRPKHNRRKKILKINYGRVAEGRAQEAFPNLIVLNSYEVGKDGLYAWYEIIMVDPEHPNIKNNEALKNMAKMHGRVDRGLTSHGRKSRGLRNKGKGAEKLRPSLHAHQQRGK